MTDTDEITAGLTRTTDDLDAARLEAAGAASHAEDVRDRVLAHGWEGIAAGMQEVIDRLEDVQAAIGRAKDGADEAAAVIGQITATMSPAEATDRLRTAIGKVGDTDQATRDAFDELDDAEATVHRVLDGGDPGELLGMIGMVGESLRQASQHADAARSKAEAEIQEAARAGN